MADETSRLPDLIRSLLITHDPIGLFREEYGNYDEYEMEVRAVAERITGVNTRDEALDLVWAVFAYWFTPSLAGQRDRYTLIADALWSYLTRLRAFRLGQNVIYTKVSTCDRSCARVRRPWDLARSSAP